MEKKISIFSDKRWLPEKTNHVIMLYPFWGNIREQQDDPDMGRFDEYIAVGKTLFSFADSIENSDYVVLPFEYSFTPEKIDLTNQIAQEAKEKHKKLIVFFNSDSMQDIEIENAVIFRTSFFKSRLKANEFAFPGWSVDFFKKYNPGAPFLEKERIPQISYCGYVDTLKENNTGVLHKLKSLFFGISKENYEYGSYIRGKVIRLLLKNELVKTDFIIRDGFWAQGMTDKFKVREEYAKNMFESPYAFVTRGAGNFSYRLYEVMSCGRIPVFVNTDSVLPYDKLIDWKKQMVWIEEKEIHLISHKMNEFHKHITKEAFMDLQKQNRKIYEEYLSPVGFFKHLNNVL